MNFSENKLPSSTKEVEWHWAQCIQEKFDFTEVNVHGKQQNFNLPVDYFNMKDSAADKIAFIGRPYGFSPNPFR